MSRLCADSKQIMGQVGGELERADCKQRKWALFRQVCAKLNRFFKIFISLPTLRGRTIIRVGLSCFNENI